MNYSNYDLSERPDIGEKTKLLSKNDNEILLNFIIKKIKIFNYFY